MPAVDAISWGWRWLPLLVGTTDSNGAMQLQTDAVELMHQWRIDRMTVLADSHQPGICAVYRNDIAPSRFIDGTTTAVYDQWESSSPFVVSGGELLIFSFYNLDPGIQVQARVHIEDLLIVFKGVDPTFKNWVK
ncbi:MAG: hypothetical protein ACYDDZ_11005 [Acidimicrobiales bacterium]